jgi:hypothetical protein
MNFHKIIWIVIEASRADNGLSLPTPDDEIGPPCHPEPQRRVCLVAKGEEHEQVSMGHVTLSRSEGSVSWPEEKNMSKLAWDMSP